MLHVSDIFVSTLLYDVDGILVYVRLDSECLFLRVLVKLREWLSNFSSRLPERSFLLRSGC